MMFVPEHVYGVMSDARRAGYEFSPEDLIGAAIARVCRQMGIDVCDTDLCEAKIREIEAKLKTRER